MELKIKIKNKNIEDKTTKSYVLDLRRQVAQLIFFMIVSDFSINKYF